MTMPANQGKTLVVLATYNEIENLPDLAAEIFRHAPDADLLVVDDNSPDGTGDWCDRQAQRDSRIRCVHRESKLGLGTATLTALKYAMDHDYQFVVNMDADFSHHPRYLPMLRSAMHGEDGEAPDVAIGSRYCPGGGVEGWPLHRRLMSRAINAYARCLLSLPVRDCSGSFRCYRVELLHRLDFEAMRSRGYSYLEEILWRLGRQSARFAERPITFVERQRGESKINVAEGLTALWILFTLGLQNWLRR